MDFVEAVKRIRNEHPEVGGLVMAKRLVERYGTYEAAKAAITGGRDPETEKAKELQGLRDALSAIHRESAARDLMPSDIAQIAKEHGVTFLK